METARIIGMVIGFVIGWALIISLPVFLLWNWLMPDIFGLPQITFWQALGLCLLSNLLIKSHKTNDSK